MADAPSLTPRQRQVLELLAEGHGNKQIAARLRVSERRVIAIVAALRVRLDVQHRAGLIAWYFQRNAA